MNNGNGKSAGEGKIVKSKIDASIEVVQDEDDTLVEIIAAAFDQMSEAERRRSWRRPPALRPWTMKPRTSTRRGVTN